MLGLDMTLSWSLGGLTVYGESQVQDGCSSESLWAPVGTVLQKSREQAEGVPAEPWGRGRKVPQNQPERWRGLINCRELRVGAGGRGSTHGREGEHTGLNLSPGARDAERLHLCPQAAHTPTTLVVGSGGHLATSLSVSRGLSCDIHPQMAGKIFPGKLKSSQMRPGRLPCTGKEDGVSGWATGDPCSGGH